MLDLAGIAAAARGSRSAGTRPGILTGVLEATVRDPQVKTPAPGCKTGSHPTNRRRHGQPVPTVPPRKPATQRQPQLSRGSSASPPRPAPARISRSATMPPDEMAVNRRLASTGSGMLEPSGQSRVADQAWAVGQWPSGFYVETGGMLLGGCAGAVQDAGGGADVHVEGDADVGVAGHAGDVGGLQVPAEQGGGAEHVPQAVPGPGADAAGVAPPGGLVGGRQDAAVEVGGPPLGAAGGGEHQSEGVGRRRPARRGPPGGGRRSCPPAGSRPGCGRGKWCCAACGPWAPPGTASRRPRRPCGPR